MIVAGHDLGIWRSMLAYFKDRSQFSKQCLRCVAFLLISPLSFGCVPLMANNIIFGGQGVGTPGLAIKQGTDDIQITSNTATAEIAYVNAGTLYILDHQGNVRAVSSAIPSNARDLFWPAESDHIYFMTARDNTSASICDMYRLSISAGKIDHLFERPGIGPYDILHGENRIVFLSLGDLYIADLAAGTIEPKIQTQYINWFALSPDGQEVAIQQITHVAVCDLSTTSDCKDTGVTTQEVSGGVFWRNDGREIAVIQTDRQLGYSITHIDRLTLSVRRDERSLPLDRPNTGIVTMYPSLDGQRIAMVVNENIYQTVAIVVVDVEGKQQPVMLAPGHIVRWLDKDTLLCSRGPANAVQYYVVNLNQNAAK
jgi:hypothetical protein